MYVYLFGTPLRRRLSHYRYDFLHEELYGPFLLIAWVLKHRHPSLTLPPTPIYQHVMISRASSGFDLAGILPAIRSRAHGIQSHGGGGGGEVKGVLGGGEIGIGGRWVKF